MRVFFQIETRLRGAPGVFDRTGSHPGDDRSQTLGRVPPRFARPSHLRCLTLHATAHVRRQRHSQLPRATASVTPITALPRIFVAPRPLKNTWAIFAKNLGGPRWRPAHGELGPSRGSQRCRHPTPHADSRSQQKLGRTRPPLPIPSAAKFLPGAGTARGATSRAPQHTPERPQSAANLRSKPPCHNTRPPRHLPRPETLSRGARQCSAAVGSHGAAHPLRGCGRPCGGRACANPDVLWHPRQA